MAEYLSNIKALLKPKNFLKIFFSKIFATNLYIGYLPEWNRHWTAFFAVIVSIIYIYNTVGFNASPSEIAYVMTLHFLYGLLLSFLMIPLFRFIYNPGDLEVITMDAYLAQILFFALSVPAIVYINIGIANFMIKMCTSFLYCNDTIFKVSTVFFTLLGPYFLLRFFDAMAFWPTANILLYAKNSFIRIFAGIVPPVIYSLLTIYIMSFLFFDLTLVEVISFYKAIFLKTYYHFTWVLLFLIKIISKRNLYILLSKIGVVKLLDSNGFINANHYNDLYGINKG